MKIANLWVSSPFSDTPKYPPVSSNMASWKMINSLRWFSQRTKPPWLGHDTLWWTNIAIENGHRHSGFSHEKWWFPIAMLLHQRVCHEKNSLPLRPASQLCTAAGVHPSPAAWRQCCSGGTPSTGTGPDARAGSWLEKCRFFHLKKTQKIYIPMKMKILVTTHHRDIPMVSHHYPILHCSSAVPVNCCRFHHVIGASHPNKHGGNTLVKSLETTSWDLGN